MQWTGAGLNMDEGEMGWGEYERMDMEEGEDGRGGGGEYIGGEYGWGGDEYGGQAANGCTPHWKYAPPLEGCTTRQMANKRAVRILLECILVKLKI